MKTPEVLVSAHDGLEKSAIGFRSREDSKGLLLRHPGDPILVRCVDNRVEWLSLPALDVLNSEEFELSVNTAEFGTDGLLAVCAGTETTVFDRFEKLCVLENVAIAYANKAVGRMLTVDTPDIDEMYESPFSFRDLNGRILWTVRPHEELHEQTAQHMFRTPIAVQTDRVIFASQDRFIIWEDGEVDLPYRSDATSKTPAPGASAMHPDGSRFLTLGYRCAEVFDSETLEVLEKFEDVADSAALFTERGFIFWNDEQLVEVENGESNVRSSPWFGTSAFGVTPDAESFWFRSHLGQLVAFPIDHEMGSAKFAVGYAVASKDGSKIATVGSEKYQEPFVATLIDVKTGNVELHPSDCTEYVQQIGLTPDDQIVVTTSAIGSPNVFRFGSKGNAKIKMDQVLYRNGADAILTVKEKEEGKPITLEKFDFDFKNIGSIELGPFEYIEPCDSNRFIMVTDDQWDDFLYDLDRSKRVNCEVDDVHGTHGIYIDWENDCTKWYDLETETLLATLGFHADLFLLSSVWRKAFVLTDDLEWFLVEPDDAPKPFEGVLPPEWGTHEFSRDEKLMAFHTGPEVFVIDVVAGTLLHQFAAPFAVEHLVFGDGTLTLFHRFGLFETYKV